MIRYPALTRQQKAKLLLDTERECDGKVWLDGTGQRNTAPPRVPVLRYLIRLMRKDQRSKR